MLPATDVSSVPHSQLHLHADSFSLPRPSSPPVDELLDAAAVRAGLQTALRLRDGANCNGSVPRGWFCLNIFSLHFVSFRWQQQRIIDQINSGTIFRSHPSPSERESGGVS